MNYKKEQERKEFDLDLNIKKEEKKPVVKEKKKVIGIVNIPLLNVRTGPGYTYTNIASKPVIKSGTEVEICKTIKDWYEVKIQGVDEKCYVAKEYILVK